MSSSAPRMSFMSFNPVQTKGGNSLSEETRKDLLIETSFFDFSSFAISQRNSFTW